MKYVSLENFRVKDIIFGEPKRGKLPNGQEYEKIYESGFDDYERAQFGSRKPDKTKEVRDVFREMLSSLSLWLDHVDELALIYDKHDLVKCRTRSLCAASSPKSAVSRKEQLIGRANK